MDHQNLYGVWANETAHLVITSKHLMLFEKVNDNVRYYACKHKIESGRMLLDLKADVCFNVTKNSSNSLFRSSENDAILQWGDNSNSITEPGLFEITIDVQNQDQETPYLNFRSDKELEFRSFEGIVHNFKSVRKINISDFIVQPTAVSDNIGYCLSNWNKFAKIEQGVQEKEVFSCEIILDNMDFNFNIMDGAFIYCSSNITASNNNGKAWDQKIRLMNHPESNQFSIYYPVNCFENLNEKIEIDDKLFVKDACNFLPGMLRYWSLDSFSDNQIIINGCGEKYPFDRIAEDPSSLSDIEFFE
jgi:hypothetical protein